MRIAVTVVKCEQVGIDTWRDIKKTKVFDSSQSLDEMMNWAKALSKNYDFHDLELSEIVEQEEVKR